MKVLTMVIEGRCESAEAAQLLQMSVRHLLRLKRAFREEGPAAVAHGNRGRRPGHAIQEELRREILELASTAYAGYNHTHLTEALEESHGISLSRRSVSRILTAAGLRSPRKRRPRRHRSQRPRMTKEGMLLQVDGSDHDWLEGRGPKLVLIGAVDDATGELVHAVFREHEDAQGYLTLLRETVRKRGIPVAWYSDRHGIFRRNGKEAWTLTEQLAGRRKPTQVARALEEMGITLILAHSPQAKGRVERCWGTLQDRLVKELRKADARTLEDANRLLKAYLPRFRKRFARRPADPQPAYRPLPQGLDLAGVLQFPLRPPGRQRQHRAAARAPRPVAARSCRAAAMLTATSSSRSGSTVHSSSSTRDTCWPGSQLVLRPLSALGQAHAAVNYRQASRSNRQPPSREPSLPPGRSPTSPPTITPGERLCWRPPRSMVTNSLAN